MKYKAVATVFSGMRGINMNNVEYTQHLLAEYDTLPEALYQVKKIVGRPLVWSTNNYRIKPTTIVGLVMSVDIEQVE